MVPCLVCIFGYAHIVVHVHGAFVQHKVETCVLNKRAAEVERKFKKQDISEKSCNASSSTHSLKNIPVSFNSANTNLN